VSIGPVTIPDQLDRPQLVVRTSANQVDFLETHRWAESLKSEIPRVLAADLDLLLTPTRVSTYPQSAGLDAEFRIFVDILRFEMTEGKGVTVDLLWSIRSKVGGTLKNGHAVASEPVNSAGYEPLVAAQSRALAAISRDFAEALRAMTTPREVK
jgi:uncharacterized lipoprotein YmbA